MLIPKSHNSSFLLKILFLVPEQNQKPNVNEPDAHPARRPKLVLKMKTEG